MKAHRKSLINALAEIAKRGHLNEQERAVIVTAARELEHAATREAQDAEHRKALGMACQALQHVALMG